VNQVSNALALLKKKYGTPKKIRQEPVETLILTILSQNTNDVNRDKAYASLRNTFSSWKEVEFTHLSALESSVRIAGLSKAKAKSIQAALSKIREEFGSYTLEPLRKLPLEGARSFLVSIKGVGPKTAAVVLSFSLGKPAFPVDTHIFRVSKRLGLIPEKTTVEKAHMILESAILPSQVYSTHLLLIRHGRETCQARKPKCPECALRKMCPYKNKTPSLLKKIRKIKKRV
jgi:endonuclease III